uniref:flavodoxin family protein n=1 Tax=Candidatus Fimivicinus sp. TaxID=3056640 RepID=UPI003FF0B9A3
MKTLLVYYSNQKSIRSLCENSAREGEVDVLELRERYDRGVLSAATVGAYLAVRGLGSKIDPFEIDLDAYDAIILATPVWRGSPVPAVNAFLHKADLRGREISGLLLHGRRHAAKAKEMLRERVRLAGGDCRDIVCVSAKELREKNCDVFSFAKTSTRLAPVLS